ncbi:hypothetical protein EON63_22885, partial [archaeon]
MTTAFSTLFPQSPALIVIEDDLLFAPDFYLYLTTGFREVYDKGTVGLISKYTCTYTYLHIDTQVYVHTITHKHTYTYTPLLLPHR